MRTGQLESHEGVAVDNQPGLGGLHKMGTRLRELTLHRNAIWASPQGDSTRGYGSFGEPYKTIEAAIAAMTATRKTVFLMPGTYTLAASVTPPVAANGGKVIGLGDVVIAASAGKIIDVDPAAATAAWSFTFENVVIQHTACVGMQIDNSAVAQHMKVNLRNVRFDMVTSGNSIDVDHTTAAKTIEVNVSNGGADRDESEIEGAVNVVVGNAGDAFRFVGCRLTGGFVTDAGAYAAELLLAMCEVKHEGITGGHASQVLNIFNSWTRNGETYAAIDANDTAGSHTANVSDDTDFGSGGIQADVIAESTSAAGVTVDGVKLKDSQVTTDVILEKTGAAGVTADGVLHKDGAVSKPNSSAAGFVTVDRIGAVDGSEGYEIQVLDYTSGVLAAVSTDLPVDIPDGSVILCAQGNIETALTGGGTTTKFGIGPVADPDKYGLTSGLTQNLKIDTLPAHAVLSGAEDVQLNAVTDAGAIGDTALTVGTVRARITIAVPNSLADA